MTFADLGPSLRGPRRNQRRHPWRRPPSRSHHCNKYWRGAACRSAACFSQPAGDLPKRGPRDAPMRHSQGAATLATDAKDDRCRSQTLRNQRAGRPAPPSRRVNVLALCPRQALPGPPPARVRPRAPMGQTPASWARRSKYGQVKANATGMRPDALRQTGPGRLCMIACMAGARGKPTLAARPQPELARKDRLSMPARAGRTMIRWRRSLRLAAGRRSRRP